jgi:hypothetical protein
VETLDNGEVIVSFKSRSAAEQVWDPPSSGNLRYY